ncbi:hypothetical protein [Thalassospira sp. CH_XMU1458]|uniref:hypothetical protein n=1 Tax=Thalassospira sp. CH_XMU1458 TaxID=3107776 RepID=UPI00300C916E
MGSLSVWAAREWRKMDGATRVVPATARVAVAFFKKLRRSVKSRAEAGGLFVRSASSFASSVMMVDPSGKNITIVI